MEEYLMDVIKCRKCGSNFLITERQRHNEYFCCEKWQKGQKMVKHLKQIGKKRKLQKEKSRDSQNVDIGKLQIEIKKLIQKCRSGDKEASSKLASYMNNSIARNIIIKIMNSGKKKSVFKNKPYGYGNFAKSKFPTSGRPVQGGAPGLGKKR